LIGCSHLLQLQLQTVIYWHRSCLSLLIQHPRNGSPSRDSNSLHGKEGKLHLKPEKIDAKRVWTRLNAKKTNFRRKKMRFGKITVIVFIVTLAALLACGQNEETTTVGGTDQQKEDQVGTTTPETAQEGQPGAVSPQTAQPGQEQGTARQVEIAGTVEQTADGVVIRSVNESYMVTGQDLSSMIGKDVRVMGTLEESEGRPTINVESVSVIE
jgi:hypothetical protein